MNLDDLRPGLVFRYAGGGCYSVIGIATNVNTYQKLIVYQGRDGADQGRLFCCTFSDFDLKFKPEPMEGSSPARATGELEGHPAVAG